MSEENEYSIQQVLMYRDGLSQEEAEEFIMDARKKLKEGFDPEEICGYWFGLGPDYIWDLMKQD